MTKIDYYKIFEDNLEKEIQIDDEQSFAIKCMKEAVKQAIIKGIDILYKDRDLAGVNPSYQQEFLQNLKDKLKEQLL